MLDFAGTEMTDALRELIRSKITPTYATGFHTGLGGGAGGRAASAEVWKINSLRNQALAARPERLRHALIDALLGNAECGSDLRARPPLEMSHYKDVAKSWA